MPEKKGFTLVEIIVVLVIIGILATISVPAYNTMVIQGAARAAQNNLITIYNAQKSYYFNTGSWCIDSSTPACDTRDHINSSLNLNITDTYFTYTCTNTGGFTCTATNPSIAGSLTLIINNQIVLPGASGTLNPSCTLTSPYCPS